MKAQGEDGYTLMELLVVMAIIGLITSVSFAQMRRSNTAVNAQDIGRRMEQHLNAARTESILKRQTVTLSIQLAEPRRLLGSEEQLLLDIPRSIAISTRSGKLGNKDPEVATYRFFSNGASSGGSITIADGISSERLEINWLTGIVERHSVLQTLDVERVAP
jgi:general secretion pathway protein H